MTISQNIRRSAPTQATFLPVGTLVRIVEPNGAGVPRALAAGGGEKYAKGTFGKIATLTDSNKLCVKFHPYMLHQLQSEGGVELTDSTMVEILQPENESDLLLLALEHLQHTAREAQPLLQSYQSNFVQAAKENLSFEYTRLVGLFENAGYQLNETSRVQTITTTQLVLSAENINRDDFEEGILPASALVLSSNTTNTDEILVKPANQQSLLETLGITNRDGADVTLMPASTNVPTDANITEADMGINVDDVNTDNDPDDAQNLEDSDRPSC